MSLGQRTIALGEHKHRRSPMNKIIVPAVGALLAAVFATHPAVAAPIPYSWTGFYVGGTVGLDSHSSTFNDPKMEITPGGTVNNNGVIFAGGVTAGYNWQYQSIVLGVEADWNWTGFNNTTPGYAAPDSSTIQAKSDWFSTVRARAGWANGNGLFYVTGGAAFVNYANAAQYTFSPYMCGQSGGFWSCPSGTATGFAVGGGFETMLWQNWSFKLEYLYLQVPTVNTTDIHDFPFSWNYHADILRLGANWHF
jgi:outer membrane immunogenic protein